jgi:hypothetical protein
MDVVGANPGVGLPRLSVSCAKRQPLQMWVYVTSVKGPLQMLCDLFEFSHSGRHRRQLPCIKTWPAKASRPLSITIRRRPLTQAKKPLNLYPTLTRGRRNHVSTSPDLPCALGIGVRRGDFFPLAPKIASTGSQTRDLEGCLTLLQSCINKCVCCLLFC